MDAKDLLVHSPQVISKTTSCMFDIKLLRFGLLIGSGQVLGGQNTVAEVLLLAVFSLGSPTCQVLVIDADWRVEESQHTTTSLRKK
jgi:hypothetical protein